MKTPADVLRERGKLGPYGRAEPSPPDPATVRAWAREHDIDCPSRGPIPAAVLAAYREG